MKNNIGKIFLGVCLILSFFFGRKCGIDSVDIPKYKSEIIVTHDTIWPDTVKIREAGKIVRKHDTILYPVEIPIDSLKLRAFFQKRAYENVYRNEDTEFTVSDTVIGYLIGQRAFYRLFKPTSIVNSSVTTVTPQDTVIKAPKWQLKGGIAVNAKNQFLTLDLEKNKNTYGIGIDPIHKIKGTNIPELQVRYSRTLFKSKK